MKMNREGLSGYRFCPLYLYVLIVIALAQGLLSETRLYAQDFRAVDTKAQESKYVALKLDKLSQLYAVGEGRQELFKLKVDGSIVYRFSENRYGAITQVDVSNPFQIAVFYEGFGIVQLLDRTLSPTQQLNLIDIGLGQVKGICLADDNTIWALDLDDSNLKQLDKDGNLINRSIDLNMLLDDASQISSLQFFREQIWCLVPNQGYFIFDRFGGFVKTLTLEGIKEGQLENTAVWYQDTQGYYKYTTVDFSRHKVILPLESQGIKHWRVDKSLLFGLFEGDLKVFESKR